MTIYQKIAKARVLFQDRGVKMSGLNKFAGYQYFELGDILPAINKIGDELGFLCVVSFTTDQGTLTVCDTETSDQVIFTSPMSTASLKGCHEVQNLGAVETYVKRYLYQNAFEIVESDAVNGSHNPADEPEPKEPSEYAKLKEALVDWGAIEPKLFTPEQEKWVLGVIQKRDIKSMKLAVVKYQEAQDKQKKD